MNGPKSCSLVSFSNPSYVLLCSKSFPPEVGLFGTDVTTDWINGANLINNGDTIWGALMVAAPFTPAAIFCLWGGYQLLDNKEWCKFLLGFIFFVPAVVVLTAGNIITVLFSGCKKIFDPDVGDESELSPTSPAFLRIAEVATESYPQSVLGKRKE